MENMGCCLQKKIIHNLHCSPTETGNQKCFFQLRLDYAVYASKNPVKRYDENCVKLLKQESDDR